jgi:hypothetical protein
LFSASNIWHLMYDEPLDAIPSRDYPNRLADEFKLSF